MRVRRNMPHGLRGCGRNAGQQRERTIPEVELTQTRHVASELACRRGSGGTPDSRGNTLPVFIKSWAGSPVRNAGQQRRHAAPGRTLPPKVNTRRRYMRDRMDILPICFAAGGMPEKQGEHTAGVHKIMGWLARPECRAAEKTCSPRTHLAPGGKHIQAGHADPPRYTAWTVGVRAECRTAA